MKMNTDKAKKGDAPLSTFGQAPFSTLESRLAITQWLSQAKGVAFRFIPYSSIVRMASVIGK